MKLYRILGFIIVLTLITGCNKDKLKVAPPYADLGVYGNIYVSEATGKGYTLVESMAIKNGKILFLGDRKQVAKYFDHSTKIVEYYNAGIILPGMFDTHSHRILDEQINELNAVRFNSWDTPAVCMEKLAENVILARTYHDPYVYGYGWSYKAFEGHIPTRQMIDAIANDIPVFLSDLELHKGIANTACLVKAGIIDKDGNLINSEIRGGHIELDKDSLPTGYLDEQAATYVFYKGIDADLSNELNQLAIYKAQHKLLSEGYTASIEGWANFFGPSFYPAAKLMDDEQRLDICLGAAYKIESWQENYNAIIDSVAGSTSLVSGEHFFPKYINLSVDGVVENKAGATLKPYLDGTTVNPLWTSGELESIVNQSNSKGLTIHASTMGDAAVKSCIDAFIKAGSNKRNSLLHIRNVDPEDYDRMRDNNINVSSAAVRHRIDVISHSMLKTLLPEPYASEAYPIKSFFNKKINASFESDYPTSQDGPSDAFSIMEIAVTGKYDNLIPWCPSECISREDAIKALTINGAIQMNMEETRGSLSLGKYADFIVVDKDILTCDENDIHNAKVIATYFEGKQVYFE